MRRLARGLGLGLGLGRLTVSVQIGVIVIVLGMTVDSVVAVDRSVVLLTRTRKSATIHRNAHTMDCLLYTSDAADE